MAVREVKDERGQTVCVVPAQHEREPRGGEYTGAVLSPDAIEGSEAAGAFERLRAYEPPRKPVAPGAKPPIDVEAIREQVRAEVRAELAKAQPAP